MENMTAKNNDALNAAKAKVEEATNLERQIDKLDDAIKFLGSEIGFLDIRVNNNNQGEVRYADLLGTKTVHDVFRKAIQAETIALREKLVKQYNNLKF